MMISGLLFNAFAIYLSRSLVVAVVVLVFFVVIMIPFSQFAVAEKYAVHNDNDKHKPMTQDRLYQQER